MALVLDAGALIAVDRRDRQVGAMLRVAQSTGVPIRSSAAVAAQVWRSGTRQANLARVLTGVDVVAIDQRLARRVGELLGTTDTSDLADAHVALLAAAGDVILTSDDADISMLLSARNVHARVQHV